MTDQKKAHHHSTSIEQPFQPDIASAVYNHRENAYHVEKGIFQLPSVTVSSNPKRAREKREREQRRCTAGRVFRWTLIAFVIAYCKEISGFMNGMVPQTVISAPRIRGDYTSIRSIHDLSSAKVKPLCFVSSRGYHSVVLFLVSMIDS
jgi:hypothetical protein